VDGVVATLLERGLIENAGRAEVIGRPMTYATTALFLEYFGLRNLDELPAADELRRIPVQRPEALVTAEGGAAQANGEGLATAPDIEKPTIVPAGTDSESSAVSPEPGATATASNPETELPR
jgi:segregation and condensation protein B